MTWVAIPAAMVVLGGVTDTREPGSFLWREVMQPQAPYAASVLDSDPRARTLALGILFPTGSADDPPGQEGTAALLASVLRRQAGPALAPYGATMDTEVSTDGLLVTLVAAPDRWRQAVLGLEVLLYESPLSPTALSQARAEVLEILTFEAGAPVRAFELARASFLLGPDARGSRPTIGSMASVGRLTLDDLATFRALRLRPEDATLAAHGPVRADELASLLSSEVEQLERDVPLATSGAALPGVPDSIPPAPALLLHQTPEAWRFPVNGAGAAAWEAGDRILMDLELTSSWISAAFPFPQGTPGLLLDFLAHLIAEDLTPSPPDPGLFNAQASTITIEGAPVLVVTATVDPRVTFHWEARLAEATTRMGAEPPRGAFFDLAKRRFRALTLMDLAVPENRVGWLARRRAAGLAPFPDLDVQVQSLDRATVSRLAETAGPPRIIVYGPRSMMDP